MKNLVIKMRTMNGHKCYSMGNYVGRTVPIITKTFGRITAWAAYDVVDNLIDVVTTNDKATALVFAKHEAREADRAAARRSGNIFA